MSQTANSDVPNGNAQVPETPNTKNQVMVTADDLPLHCPLPGTTLWNSHPRVFLPIEETGHAKCPYCGAEFTLKT